VPRGALVCSGAMSDSQLGRRRFLGTAAGAVVDHTGGEYLVRGALHGAVIALLMLAFVAIASSARLRRRPHLRRA